MATQADLIDRVLGQLGLIQAGQSPAAEDVELVSGYVAGKLAELSRRRVVFIQADRIADENFLPLVKLIANAVAPEFGQGFSQDVDDREERRLRDINRDPSAFPALAGPWF